MIINQRKSVFAGILLCCWLVWGCEKEVIVPDLKGHLVGYLYTLDEFGRTLDDHSNVHVTTTGLDGSYLAYSDKYGRYEFKNLPAGTYNLIFEKEGFNEYMLEGVKHLGGKPTILGYFSNNRIYPYTRLYAIPTTEVQVNEIIYPQTGNVSAQLSFVFPG